MADQRATPATSQPIKPWPKFHHWCRGCEYHLLPYGDTCPHCGTMTPLPVSRMAGALRPWHQLATTTVMRVGRTYIAVDYDITDTGEVVLKAIRARNRPALKLRPYYQKMIVHHIARAEGVLQ